jgi:hypothetical protein
MSYRKITAVLAVLMLAATWATAEEQPKGEATVAVAPATPQASAEDISGWIKDLDADEFKVREAATQSLIQAGEGAISPVADAAKGKSPEVTARSVSVLKALAQTEDEKTKTAALAALDKLAEDEKHESGQQARDVLGEIRPPARGRHVHGGAVGNIQIAGGGGQMAVFTIKMGGNRKVSANENGKQVDITEDNNGIVVTVTEKDDKGKPKTTTYKAADEKELKKKHPEGHKLYEKYAGDNQGNLAVQGGQINIGLAQAMAAAQARPRLNLRQATKLIDEARAELDAAIKALKAAKDGKPTAEDIAKHLKQIEAASKKLEEARKNMGR